MSLVIDDLDGATVERAGAGLAIGFSEGAPDEPRQQQAAQLLIKAGADQRLIPAWVEVGRRRAEAAKGIPYTGDLRGDRLLAPILKIVPRICPAAEPS